MTAACAGLSGRRGRTYRLTVSVIVLMVFLALWLSMPVSAASTKSGKKYIALTFDDGPSANTEKVLKVLKKYNAKATFFIVGHKIPGREKQLRAVARAGMEIGNHSWSHTSMTEKKISKVKADFQKSSRLIRKVTGKNPTLARLPMGKGHSDRSILKAAGYPNIHWTTSVGDSSASSHATADTIYRKILSDVQDGSIVLMHEWNKETVKALAKVLPALKKRGYRFVTVSQLARVRGIRLKTGRTYYGFF